MHDTFNVCENLFRTIICKRCRGLQPLQNIFKINVNVMLTIFAKIEIIRISKA